MSSSNVVNAKYLDIHKAASVGDIEEVEALISTGADPIITDAYGRDCLFLACLHGHPELGEYLVTTCDADVNRSVSSKIGGYTPILAAVRNNHLHVINMLENHGVADDATDTQGNNALHISSMWGHIAMARHFLEAESPSQEELNKQVQQPFHVMLMDAGNLQRPLVVNDLRNLPGEVELEKKRRRAMKKTQGAAKFVVAGKQGHEV